MAKARVQKRSVQPKPRLSVVASSIPAESEESLPFRRLARPSGIAEPYNLGIITDAERIQSALRQAERGNTYQLFTLYRDMVLGYSHLQAEWGKRKMVVVGQPHALIPKRKGNDDDELACRVIQQMIDNCENWMDAMTHLLDASLYPLSAAEKIFRVPESGDLLDIPVRFLLKRIEPINYVLFSFQMAYQAGGLGKSDNPALTYDVDSFEPDLRFYSTLPNGAVDFSLGNVYSPDRDRHILHRGDMLSKSIRDNYGGQMRAILFWWLLATKDRDWFAVFMQKYGSPFIVGKTDAQNKDSVDFLRSAFSTASQIGGLVIDKKAEAELIQAASQEGANAHKTLIDVCNREVSKIILGQELSSTAKNTGLGSGMAQFHGEVRDDVRLYDMMKLSETLSTQLFGQYLRVNGFRGASPRMIWGGKRDSDAKQQADTLSQFALAGVEPTDEGLEVISERVGYGLRRKPMPTKTETPFIAPERN